MNSETLKKVESAIVLFLLVFADSVAILGPINSLVKVGSYGLIFFLVIRQPQGRLFYVASRDILLLILLGFTFASALWSSDMPTTVKQLPALLRTTFFGFYLATRYDRRELMQLLLWTLTITGILSLLLCIFVPSKGLGITNLVVVWQGFYGQKQYLARAMVIGAITFVLAAIDHKERRLLYLSLLGLALFLIFMSTSRSAMTLVLVSLLLIPCLKVLNFHFKLRTAILIVVFTLVGFAVVLIAANLEPILVDFMGKNLELNGRTPLWERAIDVGLRQPWLGYGYGAFWSSPISYEVSRYLWITAELNSAHAHNGFVDTFLQLGIVGLGIFLVHYLTVLYRSTRQLFISQSTENFWMLQLVILMFFYNAVELNTILSNHFLWIFYTAFSVSTMMDEEPSYEIEDSNSFIAPSIDS